MASSWETVAIPVVGGININTPARLVPPQQLLEAQNVRFPRGAGAKKRRGHTGQPIRGAKSIPAEWTPPSFTAPGTFPTYFTGDRSFPSSWYYGFGYSTTALRLSPATALETSEYPDSGLCFGAAGRDSEAMTWDGFRLLSRTEQGTFTEQPAVLPALRSTIIAKSNTAQTQPDCADNGTIRVAAWITGTTAYYSAVDSVLGTTIVPPTALAVNVAKTVRCIPIGPWIHILVADDDTDTLSLCSVHQDTPGAVSQRSLGDCAGYFDAWKVSDSLWWVAINQGGTIIVRKLTVDGGITLSFFPSIGAHTTLTTVAICSHPISSELALVWRDNTMVRARTYDSSGNTIGSTTVIASGLSASARPVAVAPKYLPSGSGNYYYNIYFDDYSGSLSTLFLSRMGSSSGVVYSTSAFHLQLSSQAFRVGDRTFVWGANNSTYQSAWVLLDESLRSVGHADYAVASVPALAAFPSLASVNWAGLAPAKDILVHHCALGFRVRVPLPDDFAPATGTNAPAVFSEPSIHFVQLDFLPPLRSAQAGRCTYFPGAQLWSYDGNELTEAGFLLAPEGVSLATTTGSLTGNYIYRVDLCYRNAQNEEIRSASFYTSTVSPSGQSVTVTIPTVLTRRTNSYFLIFRNEADGTVWYLANSRDPASASFVRNDQSVASVTYTDNASNASLLSREQHPNQSFDYLDPFVSPAAEVIAAGRNRLWLAGGEIPFGQVYPSRLFDPGETPAFHPLLAIQVDRSAEEVTAIGFVGEYTVFFRRNHAYIQDSTGPDNILQGDWSDSRLALTDVGAVGPESLGLISGGLAFQSPAGIRLFTPGGGLQPIGEPMDALAKTLTISATVVVGADQEIRFYTRAGKTLVYNYEYNTWSTWDLSAAGAVRNAETRLALLCTPTSSLWVETDSLFTDNGQPYKQRVRFAWLRAGALFDFQRIRRIGAIGEATEDHSVHVDVYYDEREFADEFFDWDWPDVEVDNNDTFGTGNFGDGSLGDVLP